MKKYIELVGFDPGKAVHGKGNHKTSEQRLIEKFSEYIERLKKYAECIKICGNDRNSYSKTDHDATFMRMKRDHMGNDQLLPGYNIQCAVCDGFMVNILNILSRTQVTAAIIITSIAKNTAWKNS